MASSSTAVPAGPLPLQQWLRLLNTRGVDMRVAMVLASKIFKSHSSAEALSTLTAQKLTAHIPDKDQRRTILNAVKGIASGQSPMKKRGRDSDLLQPLGNGESEFEIPTSLDFNEITDPEALIPIEVTTNRAPVKTAWAYTVALKLGFDPQESLSIAHVYTHISSTKHALALGNILTPAETREAEQDMRELPREEGFEWIKDRDKGNTRKWGKGKGREEEDERRVVGSSQPWVGIMKARPVLGRPDGTWRAIEKGIPVEPSRAYLYITRAFKDYTPHVMGALKILADAWTSEELNHMGMGMYAEFKPDVVDWGQKGTLSLIKILDQVKVVPLDRVDEDVKPVQGDVQPTHEKDDHPEEVQEEAGSGSELSEPPEEPVRKKTKKELSLEEYEAMLEEEDLGGGYIQEDEL